MHDRMRVKLVSESACGMASGSISPPGATRNGVRLADVICYGMLRFSGFLKTCVGASYLFIDGCGYMPHIVMRRELTQHHENKRVAS